jgi:hypothetical protein
MIIIVKADDKSPIKRSTFLFEPILPVTGMKRDNGISAVYIRNIVGIIKLTTYITCHFLTKTDLLYFYKKVFVLIDLPVCCSLNM